MKRVKIITIVLAIGALIVVGIGLALNMMGMFLPAHADDIDRFMESRMAAMQSPGMAAGIIGPDGILWEGYYGTMDGRRPVNEDTLFLLASVSKTMVGTAAMQLWEQGKFELDDEINDYLDFEVRNPNHPEAAITFQHLLTHQSSISDGSIERYQRFYTIADGGGDSPLGLGEFLESYLVPGGEEYSAASYRKTAPGEGSEYSNYGVALLALLVEMISGEDFADYCQSHIFDPLDMEHSYFRIRDIPASEMQIASPFHQGEPIPQYSYPDYPSGALRTTLRDLSRFAAFYLDPAGSETGILQPKTVELMFESHGDSVFLGSANMGLIWMRMDWIFFEAVGHNGSDKGVSTYLLLYPEDGFATVFFMNSDFRGSDIGYYVLLRDVAERLYNKGQVLVAGQ
ncbi:MAG: beta-lactamase family protein [Anaerolineales bacterium]|nr:beta-lactamase family protein [Anaerolineales bacterium]